MTGWIARRREILAAAIGSRILVLGAAAIGHVLHWPHAVPFHIASTSRVLTTLGYWDGKWYGTVAGRGYLLIPGRQSDPAFFPLFPILLRGAHGAGLSYLTAGLLIANLAFVAGILVFYELSKHVVAAETAKRAVVLAAFFPMSFVFSMTYPESLVFLALGLFLLLAFRRHWVAAAAAGSIAVLTRPEALLFALPLAVIAVEQTRRPEAFARGKTFGAVLAPVASFATFPLYLGWALHDVFAWSHAEKAWGRAFDPVGVVRAFNGLASIEQIPSLGRDVAFAALYLLLIATARRERIAWPWLAAGAAVVLVPLGSGTFMSSARFGLLALPAYWGLAHAARRRVVRRGLLVVSAALLVAGTMTIPLANP